MILVLNAVRPARTQLTDPGRQRRKRRKSCRGHCLVYCYQLSRTQQSQGLRILCKSAIELLWFGRRADDLGLHASEIPDTRAQTPTELETVVYTTRMNEDQRNSLDRPIQCTALVKNC